MIGKQVPFGNVKVGQRFFVDGRAYIKAGNIHARPVGSILLKRFTPAQVVLL